MRAQTSIWGNQETETKTMRANYYAIIGECLEVGCRRGTQRAFKHSDDPTLDEIQEAVYDAVMIELNEKFYFEVPKEETIEPYEL